jgi:hypothetical protein
LWFRSTTRWNVIATLDCRYMVVKGAELGKFCWVQIYIVTATKRQFISKTWLGPVLPCTIFPFRPLAVYIHCTAGTVYECSTYWFSFCCNNSGCFFVFLCWAMYVHTTFLQTHEFFLTSLIINKL